MTPRPARRLPRRGAVESLTSVGRNATLALLLLFLGAPASAYAHRTADHFVPLFVALGANLERETPGHTAIEGYWLGNSKRSVEFA